MALTGQLRAALRRLEHEAELWREEPVRRVAVRNRFVHPLRVRQFHAFGARSIIDRPAWLYGTHKISIGEGVVVLQGGWIAVERPAWDSPAPVLDIRDRVGMRIGCTVAAAESILIEEDVGFGAGVTVVDSRHTWSSGHPNALYSPLESAPVRIGRGTWIADRATVAAGANIGEQCAIGSNSVVAGELPDFAVAIGNPARVVGSTRA